MWWLVFLLCSNWIKTYGIRGSNDANWANAIDTTLDNGFIIAGAHKPQAGTQQASIMKIAEDGSIVWQNRYSGSDMANDVRVTSDGGCIVAETGNNDFAVIKLNSAGVREWSKIYKAAGTDVANAAIQTSDGGYLVVGNTNSFGAGDYDILVMKLNSGGAIEWLKAYGSALAENARSVVQTSDNKYIVVGVYQSDASFGYTQCLILKLNQDGSVGYSKVYDTGDNSAGGYGVDTSSSNGCVVAVDYAASSNDYRYPKVFKLSSDGATVVWQRTISGPGAGSGYAGFHKNIRTTSDGGCIVVGNSSQWSTSSVYQNIIVTKLAADGTHQWTSRYYPTDWTSYGYDVAQPRDGGYICIGHRASSPPDSIVVLKLKSTGTVDGTCPALTTVTATVSTPTTLTATVTLTVTTIFDSYAQTGTAVTLNIYDACAGGTAVTLVDFSAIEREEYIELQWRTEAEIDNYKWLVERAEVDKNNKFIRIDELPAKGSLSTYQLIDSLVTPGLTYWYKLGDVDRSGNITWHGPVSATAGRITDSPLQLGQPIPSPFKERVRIEYQVPGRKSIPVKLELYNESGQVIRVLIDKHQRPGRYIVCWDGKDAYGNPVSAGTYFYYLKVDGELTRKLIHIK